MVATVQKPGVLQTQPMIDDLENALSAKFNHYRLWEAEDPVAFIAEHAEDIKAVVANFSGAKGDLINALPSLEIVASFSVGVNAIDVPLCRERGVAVSYTPDVLTDDCADMAVALLLATVRRVCAMDRYVRKGLWPVHGDFPLTARLSGKRLGIVGLGRIGLAIAKRAEAFGCLISYHSRSEKAKTPYTYFTTILDLARNCDILLLSCALTKETYHIVDRQVIDALGPKGTLINIARGPVVHERELVEALLEGRLGAAGLDVYEEEPEVPRELWDLDNVVLLPHAASLTWETRQGMGNLVVANLEAHFSGKPLVTPFTADFM
eukprot:TRINITY_DN11436_c0_g1_i1.p2 TRINITY_DN11436_c0_g1~~TRINITY_DN11436_c0_g1_i1.p2  ORF type:complete len:356 (+),score=40.84 TRINITY_DN11436_c0_g1_i1:104-1069(+)